MRTKFWILPSLLVTLLAVGCANKGGDNSPAGTPPVTDSGNPPHPQPVPGPNSIQQLSKTQIWNLWMGLYSPKGPNRLRNVALAGFYLALELEKMGVTIDDSNEKSFEKLISFFIDDNGNKFEQIQDLDTIIENL